jgi:hypothetical protein
MSSSRAESHVLRPLNRSSLGASPMLDVILLAVALGFFALSVGYIFACDRL